MLGYICPILKGNKVCLAHGFQISISQGYRIAKICSVL